MNVYGTSKKAKSRLRPDAIVVAGFERLPQNIVGKGSSGYIAIEFEIEPADSKVVDKVLDTHTAKEALEQIKKQPSQVILTDGTLADMDAKAFAPAVRKVLGNKPVVIIAWSSSPEAEELLLAPDSGIDDFVLKSTTSEGTGLLAAALLGSLR